MSVSGLLSLSLGQFLRGTGCGRGRFYEGNTRLHSLSDVLSNHGKNPAVLPATAECIPLFSSEISRLT